MRASLEFLLGLLDDDEPYVGPEDLDGPNGQALHVCREMGFLGGEPGVNPGASCPHCGEGVPYWIGRRYVCHACRSAVDARHLCLWGIDRDAFLVWFAEQLQLRGGVRRIEDRLWQLGTWGAGEDIRECFFHRAGPLTDIGKTRLSAYHNVLLFYGVAPPRESDRSAGHGVSLLELLRPGDSLAVGDLRPLLRPRGDVRFDPGSGAVWVGETWLGDVPVGSKEYFFLHCLASHLDRFVSYADLKHVVLQKSGSSDETEEATFCQGLKSRIKKKWVPKIDLLLTTTNKADGYRLRAHAGASLCAEASGVVRMGYTK